jgi:hypothetical protein
VARSDDFGQFRQRSRDTTARVDFDAEFVVASPQVLRERVAGDENMGAAIGLESAHRPQPRFEPAVVVLDANVVSLHHRLGFALDADTTANGPGAP